MTFNNNYTSSKKEQWYIDLDKYLRSPESHKGSKQEREKELAELRKKYPDCVTYHTD